MYRLIVKIAILLTFAHVLLPATPSRTKTLREIYKTGKIKFIPTLKITLDSVPEEIPSKSISILLVGENKLYISDLQANNIKIASKDGKFSKHFGGKGRGPGDLYHPGFICFSKERLVVWESGNRRFSFFSLDGKFLKSVKPTHNFRPYIINMKALDDGRIIIETMKRELNREKRTAFEWSILTLYSSEMKPVKELYRQKQHRYKYFERNKPFYYLLIPFSPKLCWDVLGGSRIVVGFADKYKIRILDVDTGQTKVFSHSYTPVPISDRDKNLVLDLYSTDDPKKKELYRIRRESTVFPRFKPVYKNIFCDREGHILVFPFTKSNDGRKYFIVDAFDVFDEQGNLISSVAIRDNKDFNSLFVFSGTNNEFWASRKDDNGEAVIVRYMAEESK